MQSNDYTYQNTIGRRSTLGAYYHMNKQPSYTNDYSQNSTYGGYNAWGMWRDTRNIAPSTFSAKTYNHYQKTRSFSIIITTAAFIVLLAVISIAGLAFYFSSIKANMEDRKLIIKEKINKNFTKLLIMIYSNSGFRRFLSHS